MKGMDRDPGKHTSSARQRRGWKRRAGGVFVGALILLASPWLFLFTTADLIAAANSVAPATAPATQLPSFADAAERAMPGVVNISTTQKLGSGDGGPVFPLPSPETRQYGEEDSLDEFFRRFFGERPAPSQRRSLGSGFIISSDGYIITSSHLIGNAEQIIVRLSKPRSEEYEATVVGIDELTDLALLKIAARHSLPALTFGSSANLRVGEWVVAIGNPFGLDQTVTVGIVSGKGRVIGAGPYDDFIQTDASINPGNSGGPLLNMRGEVIGINTAIFSRVGGNIGIGFAIPMDQARSIIMQLKTVGKVTRGWIGVSVQSVTPEIARWFQIGEAIGALVTEMTPNGPADLAGLMRGDVIIDFDGVVIKESNEFSALVARTAVGRQVALKVVRGGRERTLVATLGELRPPQVKAALPEMRVSRWGMVVVAVSPDVARRYRLSGNKKVSSLLRLSRGVQPILPACGMGTLSKK